MYRNERKQEILKILSTEGYTTVKQLSQLLYTSESSVRRDLVLLENQGLVSRSYGGVELKRKSIEIIPFSTRTHHNILAKKIMAKKACKLIQDGSIIFLDQSSSAFFVAAELQNKAKLTVVTNSVEITALLSHSEIELICCGGQLCKFNRNCFVGDDAQRIFKEIRADMAFFSSTALGADGVIYDCVREEICMRNTMLSNAEKKVFLCASEKFNRYSGFKQYDLHDVDYFITETDDLSVLDGSDYKLTVVR